MVHQVISCAMLLHVAAAHIALVKEATTLSTETLGVPMNQNRLVLHSTRTESADTSVEMDPAVMAAPLAREVRVAVVAPCYHNRLKTQVLQQLVKLFNRNTMIRSERYGVADILLKCVQPSQMH